MRTSTESMVGNRYGRLTVLKVDHWEVLKSGYKAGYVECLCDCGNTKVIKASSLKSGLTKSCGCLAREKCGKHLYKHGLSSTRLYRIYSDILRRCYNDRRKTYCRYGGRGIYVCDDWLGEEGFLMFYEWSMSNGYRDDLTIDRIDNDKWYSPDNCRWVDYQTQANNSSWNKHITFNGDTHTIAEWGRITGISSSAIGSRIRSGWDIAEALGYKEHKTPRKSEVLYTINGETHNIREWCRLRGLSVDTVRYRREHNWTPEEIFGFKERVS